MALTLDDLLDGLRASRSFFLKHVDGLRPDQWEWKPYPECKNVREILVHLIADDRAALEALETGKSPNYDTLQVAERDPDRLLGLLDESHKRVCEFLKANYADVPLDREICIWGNPMKLASGVAFLSSEDFYHAGQVAFIRMATDPEWDYYSAVFGDEE